MPSEFNELAGHNYMKKNACTIAITFSLLIVVSSCSKEQEKEGYRADEKRAQKISCVNNLKQIGLAFRIWAGDHGDKYPFQISTNAGGTLELVLLGKDGFDQNAFLYLKTMTNEDELRTPILLVCPQEKTKKVSSGWEDLQSENVTYKFFADTNTAPYSSKILAVCPIDGNTLYCDGTVSTNSGTHEQIANPVIFELMKKQLTNQDSR
jgi:hypothetical protein